VEELELGGQFGQPEYIDRVFFKGQVKGFVRREGKYLVFQVKNGFFIEAGADDFELHSNTLLFELEHTWTGLLVEPNPTVFPKG
jgi:hypothetical protein